MAHYCKCAVCGITFDRDKIQAVRFNARRYAHQECFPEGEIVPLPQKTVTVKENKKKEPEKKKEPTQDELDLKELKDYINLKFGKECNWAMTMKYIKKFKDDGMSYTGMLKTLIYFFDVQRNPVSKANNSIGIIPFVYQEAYKYYYNLHLVSLINEKVDSNFLKHEVREIEISSPRARVKTPRLFNFLDEEEQE